MLLTTQDYFIVTLMLSSDRFRMWRIVFEYGNKSFFVVCSIGEKAYRHRPNKNNEFRLICRSVFFFGPMAFFFVCVSLIINCSKWKVLSVNARLYICLQVYMPPEHVNQKNLTVFLFLCWSCSSAFQKNDRRYRRRMRKSNCSVYLFLAFTMFQLDRGIKKPVFLTQKWIKWNVNARIFTVQQKKGNIQ